MRGFTLLEVMIALAIMAGVILTVISAVNHHLAIAARDREEGIASLLARTKLDELTESPELPEKSSGTFAPAWPSYSWDETITPMEITGYRKMTVTVSWDGKKRSLALVSYLAK